MNEETDRIHQKNIWMLKLLVIFYGSALIINLLVEGSFSAINPLVSLILLSIPALLVWIKRWPIFTMLLTVCFLFLFFFFLIVGDPYLINYIFLGFAPLLCLFYLDLRAVLLSGVLYVVSSIYFFYQLKFQTLPEMSSRDLIYIIVFGIFTTIFSLVYTKMMQKLWFRAKSSEEQLRSTLEDLSIGIWTYDLSASQLNVSKGLEHIFGFNAEIFSQDAKQFREIIHPDDQHIFDMGQKELLIWQTNTVKEYRIICPNGDIKWVQNRARPHLNPLNHLIRLEGIMIDITERKQMEGGIEFLVYHDELTGLPNRTMLSNKFEEYCKRGYLPIAILFIDLDNFKDVNDTYGHAAGDLLLKDIAGRMLELIREQDTVCRLGGDEFVVLLTEMDEMRVVKVADRIRASLTEGFVHHGFNLTAGASIGICISLEGTGTLEEMIRQADEAMYSAKRDNGGVYKIYGEIAYTKE
ncbi:sensor domain-containing diguanylate cyclase [Paenibacillus sp. FSL K6-2524]|uniref:sensor domain-containing diguanylate cyclase n=1 Tax=Paenibacillus sp. FSL K6-2524 TaxID=2954516 RepID=UPI0030FA7431